MLGGVALEGGLRTPQNPDGWRMRGHTRTPETTHKRAREGQALAACVRKDERRGICRVAASGTRAGVAHSSAGRYLLC